MPWSSNQEHADVDPTAASLARNNGGHSQPDREGRRYPRTSHGGHVDRNSADCTTLSQRQDSPMVFARRRPRGDLRARLQGRQRSGSDHGGSAFGQAESHGPRICCGRTAFAPPLTRREPLSWRAPPTTETDMSPAMIFDSHLILGYVAWLLCFGTYIWPRLKRMDPYDAQRAIATLHSFRFFGLVFILPGVIGPGLPNGFGPFAAYGD